MELVGQRAVLSGIAAGQVGDPLAHGQERPFNCISADRVVGLAVAAIAEGEDEEVAEFGCRIRDITEGWVLAVVVAEGGPVLEVASLGGGVLGSVSGRGEVQRSAEISAEEISSGSIKSFQGRSCG